MNTIGAKGNWDVMGGLVFHFDVFLDFLSFYRRSQVQSTSHPSYQFPYKCTMLTLKLFPSFYVFVPAVLLIPTNERNAAEETGDGSGEGGATAYSCWQDVRPSRPTVHKSPNGIDWRCLQYHSS